jgi:hypothetical protein
VREASHLGRSVRNGSPSRAAVKACMKGIVCPLGISLLSRSQSTLSIPKPSVASGQLAQCLSPLHTCSGENHIGYLRGHLHEVRYFNNTPLPISIPLDKIPKNNLGCRIPNEMIVNLSEAWPCDSSMLSPLVVFADGNIWTVKGLLTAFYDSSDLRKCCTTLKDGLNR